MTYNCPKCSSANTHLDKCRCGIPCILKCLDCGKTDYDLVPHKRT